MWNLEPPSCPRGFQIPLADRGIWVKLPTKNPGKKMNGSQQVFGFLFSYSTQLSAVTCTAYRLRRLYNNRQRSNYFAKNYVEKKIYGYDPYVSFIVFN